MMGRRFAHPDNGHEEAVGVGSVVLTALLGPLFLVYKQAWFAALLTLLFAWPVVFFGGFFIGATPTTMVGAWVLGFIAWAMAMQPLIETAYLRRGWREVS